MKKHSIIMTLGQENNFLQIQENINHKWKRTEETDYFHIKKSYTKKFSINKAKE